MGKDFLENMQIKEVNLHEGVFGDLVTFAKNTAKGVVGDIKKTIQNSKDMWKDSKLTGRLKDIGDSVLNALKSNEPKIKELMPYLEKDKDMLTSFSNLIKATREFESQLKIRTK